MTPQAHREFEKNLIKEHFKEDENNTRGGT